MATSALVSQSLLLGAIAILGLIISRATRLEMTLSCLVAGLAGGIAVAALGLDTGLRAATLQDLIFYFILPILIFDAAWHLKPSLLRRWLGPALILASVGVLISCFVFAGIAYLGIGYPDYFPWIAALLAGAIIAATDPVAVVACLQKLRAPEDLATLIESESLFNDATAVVLFGLVLAFATNEQGDTGSAEYLLQFFWVFVGGILVGLMMALLASLVILLLADRSAANVIIIFLAFSSFYVAEHLVHVSGIMSVMAAAILAKSLLHEQEQGLLAEVASTWSWLNLFFTAVLFAIMGLVIQFDMFKEQWLAMLVAIVAALVARAAVVFVIGFMTRVNVRPIPFSWQMVQFWGGLKGAIAIALVLSLPTSLSYWWTIQSMVFGVVLFSLLVQGPSIGILIKKAAPSRD